MIIKNFGSVCNLTGVVRKRMNLYWQKFQVTEIISQQITRSLVLFGLSSHYYGLPYSFLVKILVSILQPTWWKSTWVLLDKPEKFEEKFPLKTVRGSKMNTIKNHSLNSIICDDNGAYTQRRTTKTNYLVGTKSNSAEIKAQIVHKNDRCE